MEEILNMFALLKTEIEDCQVGMDNDAEIDDAIHTLNVLKEKVLKEVKNS